MYVRIDLVEALRGVSRAEVLPPASEERIEDRDDIAQIRVTSSSWRPVAHLLPDLLHRASRRPTMQVVHALSLAFPDRATHALVQMTAEKIEALLSIVELDLS